MAADMIAPLLVLFSHTIEHFNLHTLLSLPFKFVTLAMPTFNSSMLLLHVVSLQLQFTFYKLFYAADV
jgi:hypothetical protein